eukprot:1150054-Pelagomonas_calceolata.AAC.3
MYIGRYGWGVSKEAHRFAWTCETHKKASSNWEILGKGGLRVIRARKLLAGQGKRALPLALGHSSAALPGYVQSAHLLALWKSNPSNLPVRHTLMQTMVYFTPRLVIYSHLHPSPAPRSQSVHSRSQRAWSQKTNCSAWGDSLDQDADLSRLKEGKLLLSRACQKLCMKRPVNSCSWLPSTACTLLYDTCPASRSTARAKECPTRYFAY